MANATSRITLLDNGDFSLHAQLSRVQSPIGGHALTPPKGIHLVLGKEVTFADPATKERPNS